MFRGEAGIYRSFCEGSGYLQIFHARKQPGRVEEPSEKEDERCLSFQR